MNRSPEQIRDISVHVYKSLLAEGDVERMLAKDGDNGEKLRARAGFYDKIVKLVLEGIND